jgi:histone deacetylase complex regulatory component SIN3
MQVSHLFADHHDLLEEFTYFLPDSQTPHREAMERRQRLAEQQALQRTGDQATRRRPANREHVLNSHVRPPPSSDIDVDVDVGNQHIDTYA